MAGTGKLSMEVAKLRKDMDANEAAREMAEAIDILAKIGADQTADNADSDHGGFMAADATAKAKAVLAGGGANLLKVSSSIKKAQKEVMSFIQAPAYTSQSGKIVGILKNMRDTFKTNLASARQAEKTAQEAHDKFMQEKKEAYEIMKESF